MLSAIIRFALRQRLLVIAIAVLLVFYGSWQIAELPIDVFPDLNRPRVTVMTEAPGMAPEEVETLITIPLETALSGATGVQAVRTSSGVGLSVVWVEFDWDTDIYNDRQIVAERIALVADRLPPEVTPQLAPIASVMGQIMIIGMWVDERPTAQNQWSKAERGRRPPATPLDTGHAPPDAPRTSPMELRTLADWVVRQRLLTISGVSQVFVLGGDRRQFQVLVNPNMLLKYGVTLAEVKRAVARSNRNATGGYLDEQGPNELLVRSLGRIQTVADLEGVVVKSRDNVRSCSARSPGSSKVPRSSAATAPPSHESGAEHPRSSATEGNPLLRPTRSLVAPPSC
jgi:HME family heavy-metal exporter